MEWETIVKLADQRVVIIDQSMNFPTLASPGADIPTSWAPVVTRTCEFDQNELVAGRQDIPYSIIFQDGWRMMWWENFDTEDVLRFHLHDLNEPVPKTTSFSGILAQSRPEDKGKSLLCHSFYSVSAILGRGIYVSEDRTEFYVLDYDLPALPTQNNLSGSPCEDKQSKKKNRGLFRAKRIIKRMRKLLKLKNGN
ncbi:hypothetical protein DL96DRAFT_17815 [Flagelloscypha sp. PMI_526]|nr:hypothetical protein DL96DRAFT_17815 [Flagelloscypha sp. PMI_526]